MRSLAELLAEADTVPFVGWDFSWLGDRLIVNPPPWSFERLVRARIDKARRVLDLGTGGGEWLSGLVAGSVRPGVVVATESWPPNVSLASARLGPLGIAVVQTELTIDNVDQSRASAGGRLPFRDRAFDALTSRHEAFVAKEVGRVLRPGGVFITQQSDSGSERFHELLGLQAPEVREFNADLAIAQLEHAGLVIEDGASGEAVVVFADVGALAWYLRVMPWAVPGFTVAGSRDALQHLWPGPIAVRSKRFWLLARRPT